MKNPKNAISTEIYSHGAVETAVPASAHRPAFHSTLHMLARSPSLAPIRRLRSGVSCAAVAAACIFPLPALGGSYFVSNETELRQAIADANADGDPDARITLTADVTLPTSISFPSLTKPVTIDTGEFVLRGDSGTVWGQQYTLYFPSGHLIIDGTVQAGNAPGGYSSGDGIAGVAVAMDKDGTIENNGTVIGGSGAIISGTGASGFYGGPGIFVWDDGVTVINNGEARGGKGEDIDVGGENDDTVDTRAGTGGAGLVFRKSSSSVNNGTLLGGEGGSIRNPGSNRQFGGNGGVGAAFLGGGVHVNNGTIQGGAGGRGINGAESGHGAGGTGVRLVGGSLTNSASGRIVGANGQAGGGAGDRGGSRGGTGLVLTNASFVNMGVVQAGDSGANAQAGTGIVASNATIINSGTISAGTNDVGTRGVAIEFTENTTNTLELRAGSNVAGLVSARGADMLVLGGEADATFDAGRIGGALNPAGQFQQFESFKKTGASTWTLTGTTPELTPWELDEGVLSVSSDGSLGAAGGTLTFNGGTLRVTGTEMAYTPRNLVWGEKGGSIDIAAAGHTFMLAQQLTGGGSLTKLGAGTLALTGAGQHTGGTTIASGTLQIGAGGASGSLSGDVVNNGTLAFNRSNNAIFAGIVSGSGGLRQIGSGSTSLTGANSYAGATSVEAGSLFVNGDQSAATGRTTVHSAATLGGTGILGGGATIADGGALDPGELGSAPGTLTVKGDLALAQGSILNYNFGQAGVVGGPLNDLVEISGDLVLDGTLNVATSSGGSFSPGVYRVINYGGTLTDNGLLLGTLPSAGVSLQLSVANQVNLINAGDMKLNFWDGSAGPKDDGAIDGGDGVWQNSAGNDNWTDAAGAVNAPFEDGAFATFMGTPGKVVVDESLGAVSAAGMQFATDGYRIEGDRLTLVGPTSTIRVGVGTAAGKGMTATIASELSGSPELVKEDAGILVLTGSNSYNGGTRITGGTLRIASDGNLGAAAGGVILDGGTLNTTADIATDRAFTLEGGGALSTDLGTRLTLGGSLTGAGNLFKTGAGTLLLAGDANYTGGTILEAGTLKAAAADMFSAGSAHTVLQAGTLHLSGFDQTVAWLDNAGDVVMGGAPGTTLSITGDYKGSGGTIRFNTALGEDASKTDRLVVGGATSGSTNLKVVNAGGRGAPTREGIKVVDVEGASEGTFSLVGDYLYKGEQAVVAGAYAYRLFKNGISTPTDGDWYLRSALAGDPTNPQYQPGVPLYEVYPQSLQSFNSLGTLRERVGNRSWADERGQASAGYGLSQSDALQSDDVDLSGNWARIEAAHGAFSPEITTAGADYTLSTWKIQGGADRLVHQDGNGKLVAGFSLHAGSISADITSVHGDGTINTIGYGFTGTLTWYGESGFYIDGQGRASWFNSDINSTTANRELGQDNTAFGYSVSIEGGKRMAIGDNWSLTPQVQLAYSSVDFNAFTDTFGSAVSLDRSDSLLGRLSLSADYENTWITGTGRKSRANVYGIASLYNEFLNGSTVAVSGEKFTSKNEPLWGGIGFGGSYNWADDSYAVYGEVLAKGSLENLGDNYSLNWTAGFRAIW
uniref:Outer membrane autotransporter barrel domain n=1 Tax=Chelativorans sp. (strain BNC1) TaxID=266779 RepID=Q11CH2_CHESB